MYGEEHITFLCDECGAEAFTDTSDFLDAVKAVKSVGWVMRKDKYGNWSHFCSKACAGEDAASEFSRA